MSAQRISPPFVTPLEVWDLPVGGKLLQMWRSDDAFPERLADAVALVRARHPAIAHVHLAGGGASVGCADAVLALGVPCTRDDDPFTAALAGAALVRGAACADIGQTGVKLARGEATWRVRRDLARAPLRDDVPLADRAAARASTVAVLAEALATTGARQLVVALPCELDAAGQPLGCTYCWPPRDPALLADLSRLAQAELAVLNDAELATVGAAPKLPRGLTSLVLTLGFGVGAALWAPR